MYLYKSQFKYKVRKTSETLLSLALLKTQYGTETAVQHFYTNMT